MPFVTEYLRLSFTNREHRGNVPELLFIFPNLFEVHSATLSST